jgi:trehalose 6-phosphate synthase/phosphatase
MPTGVRPERFLAGFAWDEFKWRRGELLHQFEGKTVMMGIDDMDVFKGIELKLQALERLLQQHAEWRGRLVLVQVCNGAEYVIDDFFVWRTCVLMVSELFYGSAV